MPSSSAASVPAGALAEASVGGSTSWQTSMAAYVSQMVAAGALPGCPDWAKPSKGCATSSCTGVAGSVGGVDLTPAHLRLVPTSATHSDS